MRKNIQRYSVRKWAIFALALVALVGYWNFRVYQKTIYLRDVCQPFVSACQQATGCIINPAGWKADQNGGYYNDGMEYNANHESFTVRWKIATDVSLIASGGRSKELAIRREVD